MNAEVFADWLERQGHKIYKTSDSYWFDAAPRVLQAFPYHWLISPVEEEIHGLMKKHGIIAMRYSATTGHREGKMSYHIVQNSCYDLYSVKHQARNGVKRGLEKFRVEEITFDRLADEGWQLQEDTLVRQHRPGAMSRKQWNLLCHAAKDLPGFHALGAISGTSLAGAMIVCQIDDIITVPYSMSHCRYLHEHVNNAMFFSASCQLLKWDGVKGIFFCVESLDAPSKVDEFKFRMGFQAKPVRQRVEFNPLLKAIAVPSMHKLTRKLSGYFPSNSQIAKAEGMLRFYLEGKMPSSSQTIPGCPVHVIPS